MGDFLSDLERRIDGAAGAIDEVLAGVVFADLGGVPLIVWWLAIAGVARAVLEAEPKLAVDYVQVVDLEDFRPVEAIEVPVTLALACDLAGTRLIDNVLLEP